MATATVKASEEREHPRPLVVLVEEPDDLVADALRWAVEFAAQIAEQPQLEGTDVGDEAQALVACCRRALALQAVRR